MLLSSYKLLFNWDKSLKCVLLRDRFQILETWSFNFLMFQVVCKIQRDFLKPPSVRPCNVWYLKYNCSAWSCSIVLNCCKEDSLTNSWSKLFQSRIVDGKNECSFWLLQHILNYFPVINIHAKSAKLYKATPRKFLVSHFTDLKKYMRAGGSLSIIEISTYFRNS